MSNPANKKHLAAAQRIETSLRDLIHNVLGEGLGQGYWKRAVPEDVRSEVEKRIETALRKQLKLKSAEFDKPREKLNLSV